MIPSLKHSSLAAVTLLLFTVAGPAARAQQSPEVSPEASSEAETKAQGPHRARSVASQLDRLTTQLHLTPDQQTKIKNILDRRRAEMLQLRKVQTLSATDRFAKVEVIRKGTVDDINGVLTEAQRKIFRPVRQRNGGGAAAPGPAAESNGK